MTRDMQGGGQDKGFFWGFFFFGFSLSHGVDEKGVIVCDVAEEAAAAAPEEETASFICQVRLGN